jgi:formimidoylglutamate deiminase
MLDSRKESPVPEVPSSGRSQTFHALWALLPDGWHQNMAIEVDDAGLIASVGPSSSRANTDILVPGMINAHSHAFQRGLLGRTQRFQRAEDDFWSWRTGMYKQAGLLTPETQEDVAFRAFTEMVSRGYTTVCEFHYTHGASTMDHGEMPVLMSEAVLKAAQRAGIRIRLLPVCYQRAGFGQASLRPEQRPFGLNTDVYLGMIEHLATESGLSPLQSIGYAPHSLRAVELDTLRAIQDHRDRYLPEAPIHIHVAEQIREVNECVLSLRRRPVEYLMEAVRVDGSWCLIHATHMTPEERRKLVATQATVCLCPTTEGDLGDGLFPLSDFVQEGGRWAIGSDSNVCIDPAEELRMLDWQQRLSGRKRNPFRFDAAMSASTRLYHHALEGGRGASSLSVGRIEKGSFADFIELNSDTDLAQGCSPDEILSAWIYSSHPSLKKRVIVGGKGS